MRQGSIFIALLPLVSLLVFGCESTSPTPTPSPSQSKVSSVPSPEPSAQPSSSPSPDSGFDGSSNIPAPPHSAVSVSQIQELNSWSSSTGAASQCPNGVASSSCDPLSANYNSAVEHPTDPAVLTGSNGVTGEFQLDESPAYATALWGHSLTTDLSARNFIWDFYVWINTTAETAAEMDLYDSLNNGQRFMMGSQCNRSSNSWDTWSEAAQQWIHNSNVPCNEILTAGSWHHVTFYNTVNSANNTYTYQVLRIDGIDYVLNQSQSTKSVGWPNGLIGVQIQLDANSSGTAVNEYFENMQLYAW